MDTLAFTAFGALLGALLGNLIAETWRTRRLKLEVTTLQARVVALESGAVIAGTMEMCGCGHLGSMHERIGCLVETDGGHFCRCARRGPW